MIIILKDEFVRKVNAFAAKHEMFRSGERIVVAVSGGADSLALLYYLAERKEKEDLFIVVAHVDHMFRGEESWEDLLYVQGICGYTSKESIWKRRHRAAFFSRNKKGN